MPNIRIKRSTELTSEEYEKEHDEEYERKDEEEYEKEGEEECCCDDDEPDSALPVVSPTIEDFINIIEESNVLEDRDLSLKLILLVDVFIEIHLYKNCHK